MTNRPAWPPCLRETSHDGGGTIEVSEFRCNFGPEPYSPIICDALSAFSSFVARRNASEMMDGVGRHKASRDGGRCQAQTPWWLLMKPWARTPPYVYCARPRSHLMDPRGSRAAASPVAFQRESTHMKCFCTNYSRHEPACPCVLRATWAASAVPEPGTQV